MANSIIGRLKTNCLALGVLAGLVVGVPILGTTPASAAKPTTWIVLDAASGQILNERDPDALNYPASLTKMMTLFLTFDALEHHRISLDQRFEVSRHASVQRPSKLGLVPGSTIAVRDLILSVVTHSANDSAVVLAEGLAGSETAFAVRMNAEARALGMSRTNFRNASGLPDRFQYTTARDLSKLALALYRTFPKEYHYFSTESFTYNGETYGNHNHLMEAFEGMDGIKTGFINASGFNLAASAVRDNRRLIGVIMGGRTASSRDMQMASLLDDAFAHRGSLPGQAPAAIASHAKPEIVHPYRTAENEPVAQPAPLHFRNGDELSAIASALAAAPVDTVVEPDFDDHAAERSAGLSRHDGHRHISLHHALRHGVLLASDEETALRHVKSRHHRRSTAFRHHSPVHRAAAGRHPHHSVMAARHSHSQRRVAELRTHVRNASAAKSASHRGAACGGWNGNFQPCPAGLSTPRHDLTRSATATIGAVTGIPAS